MAARDPQLGGRECGIIIGGFCDARRESMAAGKVKKLVSRLRQRRRLAASTAPSLPPEAVASLYRGWRHEEVAALLDKAKPDKTSKRYDWKGVAAKLKAAGYHRTPVQCRNKHRALCPAQPGETALWPELPRAPSKDGVPSVPAATWSNAQRAAHAEYLGLTEVLGGLAARWTEQKSAIIATRKQYVEVAAKVAKHAAFLKDS